MRSLRPLLLALAACAAPAPPEWRPLFNGTDLAGWVPVNVAPSTFTAREGMIVCTGQPTGVMRTDRMYENFVLQLEYRHLQPGGNAGLFVWSDPLPARGVPFTRSLEVQVMDGVETPDYTSHGDVFSIWGAHFVPDRPHPSGWERCLPSERRARPAPEWNHYRVTCRDGVIELEVNGAKVSGGREASPRKGYLCLESEGSEVHFRNLRILELPPGEPPLAAELVAEDAIGLATAFDGLTLDGWRAADGGAADPAHWQVRDGVMWTDGQGGDLVGPALGRRFEVALDWKRSERASLKQPFLLPCRLPNITEPGSEDWHRLVVRAEAPSRDRAGTVTMTYDGQSQGVLVLDAPWEEERPAVVQLHPEGMATEFRNIYVRDL